MGAVILGLAAYAWRLDSRTARYGAVEGTRSDAAAGEFAGAMAGLDRSLREASYATDSALRSVLCAEAAAEAASAVTALAALPASAAELDTLANYLNGAWDYALCLSREAAEGRPFSHAEREALRSLSDAVEEISRETGGIYAALDAGELTMDAYGEDPASGSFGGALAELDAALAAFPELNYDGAYAATGETPALIEGAERISETAARQKAADFLGTERLALEPAGLTGGELPCFVFEAGDRRVYVTETGGEVLSITGGCSGGEAALGMDEARETALAFVSDRLGGEFTVLGGENRGAGYAFTLAPVESGVLLLADTVSLTIDAATGEVCGYDAAEYIAHHSFRSFETPIEQSAAASAVNPELTPNSAALVLTRSDGGDETLCWQFDCTDGDGRRVLVCVDAKSGREVKIDAA